VADTPPAELDDLVQAIQEYPPHHAPVDDDVCRHDVFSGWIPGQFEHAGRAQVLVEAVHPGCRTARQRSEQGEQIRRQAGGERPPAVLVDVETMPLCPRRSGDVALVHGDADPRATQTLGQTEPAETRADHDHMRAGMVPSRDN